MNNIDFLVEQHLKLHRVFIENRPWTIKESNLGGRGLFTKRKIKAGEVIFKDTALIIGPRASLKCPIVCVNCYQNENLYACKNNCGLAVCSKNCQNSLTHKKECEIIQRSIRNVDFSDINQNLVKCLTPIRALLLDSDQKSLLSELIGHAGSQHGFEVDILKNQLNLNFSTQEENLMRMACSVLDANSFEVIIGNEDKQSSLRGLYPLSSLMNHNCVPNTMHIFDKNQIMIVKATVDIPEGQELFHCYTRLFWGTSVRRPHLIRTKHFYCNCPRCEDVTEFGTNMSAIKCLKCPGLVLPFFSSEGDGNMTWKCTSCKETIPNAKVGFLIKVFGSSLNSFEFSTPEGILHMIKEKLEKHLSFNSQILLELKYKLVWTLGYDEKYLWKDLPDKLLTEKEQICRDLLHVLEMLKAGKCKMRGLLLYEFYACLVERQKRARDENDQNYNLEIQTEEMKSMFEEAKEILMHDVHAPQEIKVCSA